MDPKPNPVSEEQRKQYEACFAKGVKRFEVGDFYEDCDYIPCIALNVNYGEDSLDGINLLALMVPHGPQVGITRSCSLRHCGPRRILRTKIGDYLKLVLYQRHIIENRAAFEADKDWMAWFGDRLDRMAAMVKWADELAR